MADSDTASFHVCIRKHSGAFALGAPSCPGQEAFRGVDVLYLDYCGSSNAPAFHAGAGAS